MYKKLGVTQERCNEGMAEIMRQLRHDIQGKIEAQEEEESVFFESYRRLEEVRFNYDVEWKLSYKSKLKWAQKKQQELDRLAELEQDRIEQEMMDNS